MDFLLGLPWRQRNQHNVRPIQPQPIHRQRGGAGLVQQNDNNQEERLISPLRQLLDALNMSILPHDLRLSAISQAVEFFDHRDRTRHDFELREGAACIIYQKLAFALHQSNYTGRSGWNATKDNYSYGGTDAISSQRIRSDPDSSDADHELAMLTSCLEMVHRASAEVITFTWNEIGSETLPILIKILERPFAKMNRALEKSENNHVPGGLERTVANAINRDMKIAVQKVTKVLAVYSLVPEAKVPMASCPGMLPVLVKIIDTHHLNRMNIRPASKRTGEISDSFSSSSGMIMEGRSMALGANGIRGITSGTGLHMTEASRFNTIAILTNLAAAEPNRMMMLSEPGLVDNIARVVHNERSDIAHHCSALAIMNLSNGDREHVPELAGNDLLMETLIKLLKDDTPEIRRNAAVALFNVACADQNTVKLARYKEGMILEALVKVVSNDEDTRGIHEEARTNAAEALFNMSCSAIEETTDRIANHPGLLELLAVTLKSSIANVDAKMYAAATLRRMSEIIHAPKKSQGALLSALVKGSSWTRTACIAEAFLSQAEIQQNRLIMAEHHGLLNALSKLALNVGGGESDRVRSAAVSAIENMSRERSSRSILAHNEGIMMALTRASYGISASTSSLSRGSPVFGSHVEEEKSSDDLPPQGSMSTRSIQSDDNDKGRQIQKALKHLVDAM